MASVSLTVHDINVLEKIKDPESNPLLNVRVDASLPRDPHITDKAVYERLVQQEREIVLAIQAVEFQLLGLRPKTEETDPLEQYRRCISRLGDLVAEHPTYASARNNRVQALRRLYGDEMLVANGPGHGMRLIADASPDDRRKAAATALDDLETSVRLLTPSQSGIALSPQAAKTLSLAHTQRAAIYHATAKIVGSATLDVEGSRVESTWSKLNFEEAASRDFALGGRYGNEIAKGLAVSTNPTAKLCGQMVREAMKKEYGPDYAV